MRRGRNTKRCEACGGADFRHSLHLKAGEQHPEMLAIQLRKLNIKISHYYVAVNGLGVSLSQRDVLAWRFYC
jgi:hypothetical protein